MAPEASLHPGLTGQWLGIFLIPESFVAPPSASVPPKRYHASSPPSLPTQKPFHRAGSERWQLRSTPPSARAPMLPPVPRLLWLAQGGELGQGTQCGSLFPRSACWNWPISCLGLGAFSKVNKQIQRSRGLGWRKGCWGFPTPGTPRAGSLFSEGL